MVTPAAIAGQDIALYRAMHRLRHAARVRRQACSWIVRWAQAHSGLRQATAVRRALGCRRYGSWVYK